MHGPYTQLINNNTEYVYRSWYRTDAGQPRTPLPYSCVRRTKGGVVVTANWPTNFNQTIGEITAGSDVEVTYPSCVPSMQTLQYAAYSKFRERFREEAEALTNTLQWGQAYTMVNSVLKALKKPHQVLGTAMVNLAKTSLRTPQGARQAMRNLGEVGNMWLAWHFGAVPLYQDLHSAYKVLTTPTLDLIRVFAQKKAKGQHYVPAGNGTVRDVLHEHINMCVKYCAWMEITNPNAYMASQLGLLNPVATAYEVLPWSFLFDWFFPIGPYLSSLTDLVGVKLRIPYTTAYAAAHGNSVRSVLWNGKWESENARFTDVHWSRTVGISLPPPRTVRLPNMSPTRIATAAALAFQPIVQALKHPAVIAARKAQPAYWPKWAPPV